MHGNDKGAAITSRELTQELNADPQDRSRALAVAAHKLRTPLVGILGFSELLLKRDFDDQKRREVLETIYRQADSFKKILDNYMDLERLDATQGKDFKFEQTTLEDVLEQVVSDPLFTDRSADIKLISPERWPQVNVDIDRIRQVLMQLVSNAANYSSAGGEIICRTQIDNDDGQQQFGVSIADNGPGLTPEELSRVGERFYRVDESASVPGGGLGLALAVQIISLHNGRLLLESKKGEGTTATFWLPVIVL